MQGSLNVFMSLGSGEWRKVREAVTDILREDNSILRDNASLRDEILIPMVRLEQLCTPECLFLVCLTYHS